MAANTHHVRLRELAHRTADGIDVSLFWHPPTDELTVCVFDHQHGSYFEITPEGRDALDAYYHPYSYATSFDVHFEDERLAA